MADEHFEVLIVGAGLSGIGAACHLRRKRPGASYAILEARDAIGGTWDLFRYPGIRSDSDMFTLGYSFRPWDDPKAIADGASILRYVEEAAREHGADERVRFSHRVVAAEWSSVEARWTVTAEREGGATSVLTCDFLFACTGYYRYDRGHSPELPGRERFGGEVVHPQHWPQDLDYEGKRVVVVGSGATAVTLVPTLAERAAAVTMLQRSPTFIASLPHKDPLARLLRGRLPAAAVYSIVRWKNVVGMMLSYQLSRRAPRLMRWLLRRGVEAKLPPGFDVDTHFEPLYDPWDERLCLAPGGDLFAALAAGRAEIVTDRIETFTESGVRLSSGRELEADLIVTATGLELLVAGGIELSLDGESVDLSRRVAYKGMMFSGIPNLAVALGYTNASWTLKSDLVAEYVCRLLGHMEAHGYRAAIPREPGAEVAIEPIMDLQSGYVKRSLHLLPKQGSRRPWRLHQNYFRDLRLLRRGPVDDEIALLR